MHRVELLRRDTRLATAEQWLKSPDAGSSGLGFPRRCCSVLFAFSCFWILPRAQETALPTVIKLPSFAGSAHRLLWKTFLPSKSEYPGQTGLRAARLGAGGRSLGPQVRGRVWEGSCWLQEGTAWGNARQQQEPAGARGNPIPCCDHA